jgi:hypothetical protein
VKFVSVNSWQIKIPSKVGFFTEDNATAVKKKGCGVVVAPFSHSDHTVTVASSTMSSASCDMTKDEET